MYKYHCTNCSYIYNPYIGDMEQDIESGTDFEDLDEDWRCPVCSEGKEGFVEIVEKIHEYSDINNLLPQEEQHVPYFYKKDDSLFVQVGTEDDSFVQDDVHFVEYIGIFDDSGDVIDIIQMPNIDDGPLKFDYPDYDEWEVRLGCSLHGVWKGIEMTENI